MKRNTIRVALTFATFSAKDVNCLLILVIVCMKNNTLFPNLPVTLASLTAIQTALQNAIAGAAHGGTVNTAVQSEAKDNAIVALRQTAAYVQSLAPTLTMSQVLTSGFDVVMPNNKPGPLDTPVFTLDNSIPAQLAVWLQAVANAKAYQIQIAIGTGPWLEAGIAASTQNIVLTNLLSLTVYNVRIRAVGGSTKYSPWSATVSLLVT